jgi:hypothetical protein
MLRTSMIAAVSAAVLMFSSTAFAQQTGGTAGRPRGFRKIFSCESGPDDLAEPNHALPCRNEPRRADNA